MPELSRFIMQEVELPLIEVVADMEDAGYQVDCRLFDELRGRLEPERAKIVAQLRCVAGSEFNPNSAPQVAELLYNTLKIPVTQRTDKGHPATSEAVLERIDHPFAKLILQYRSLSKIIDTYCSIPQSVDGDGRLHVTFKQLGAETGRFTSGSVIQTLPKADEYNIRKGFTAAPGKLIVAADFDQQELRVLAAVSGDENMLQAVAEGVDLHGLAAIKVFGLDCQANEVKVQYAAERKRIKAIQFGLIYGRSAGSLARELEISQKEATKLQEDYFHQFPGVKAFVEKAHEEVTSHGCVTDVFGRCRHLPNARLTRPRKSYASMTKAELERVHKINAAKRAAQNFLIQGAAATITKLAMLRCHQHLKAEHPDIKMIVQVHDELHFDVPQREVEHFTTELPDLMCNLELKRCDFHVCLAVNLAVGPSWGELQPCGD
jgi:DNA polymerase-1